MASSRGVSARSGGGGSVRGGNVGRQRPTTEVGSRRPRARDRVAFAVKRPGGRSPGGGHLTTVNEHQHHVNDIVHHFQELNAREEARREEFIARWDDRFEQFRAQCEKVEGKMKDRHESQLAQLRATLENNLLGDPPRWSSQLEELRRMQKVLVRHKRFGEALDLLKVADEKEGEEVEAHREKVRADNVTRLQELFDQQAQERTVFMKECQAEEERLKINKTRGQLLLHEHTKRVEDEATRRMDALGASGAGGGGGKKSGMGTRTNGGDQRGKATMKATGDSGGGEEED